LVHALLRAADYLVHHQDEDGAWRPDTYGVFKDGPSLTPLVLHALHFSGSQDRHRAAYQRGVAYLANLVKRDGSIDSGEHGLSYPVYTSAGALLVLSHPGNEKYEKAKQSWLRFLWAHQLTEQLGWKPTDREYGGWGYCSGVPRKPSGVEAALPLTESNLSATAFAVRALRAAGIPTDDERLRKALVFLKRCQNYPEDAQHRDERFDDGGFFFIDGDPLRNKAGAAGKDLAGRERFTSYGSTTADGLGSLLACGLSISDPRVAAAKAWLEAHFAADHHPGCYAPERAANRDALYFYYCCSLAEALAAYGRGVSEQNGRLVNWTKEVSNQLLARQRPDGSWQNLARAVREDEPVLATAFVILALANCRDHARGCRAGYHKGELLSPIRRPTGSARSTSGDAERRKSKGLSVNPSLLKSSPEICPRVDQGLAQ
jgi:squalene-hopene/tetraprenyl-beta-curcumene cyclase